MRLTYRTRRNLQRFGIIALTVFVVLALVWLCSVIWLERYVVYTRDGATLNFDLPAQSIGGVVATPPEVKSGVSIFYNEGSDAIELNREMTKLNGYYISYNALSKDLAGVFDDLKYVKAGTPVMIELKGDYGTVYYGSNVSGAVLSQSVEITRVDELIQEMKSRGFYMIARISAFRDYDFGNKNPATGLPLKGSPYLWLDDGYYWLNPTNSNALGWVTAFVMELKNMGFNEVMLANFRFPAQTDKYTFNGDMEEAIQKAAKTVVDSCSSDGFVISFGVPSTTFHLPEGRTRMYLEKVDAKDVAQSMAQVELENPEVRVVFLGETNDTRFDAYSVLRPISSAEVLEAQKDDLAAQEAANEE